MDVLHSLNEALAGKPLRFESTGRGRMTITAEDGTVVQFRAHVFPGNSEPSFAWVVDKPKKR